jgi:alkylation response protein AidB-like acyl-CoA dehydrogenase
VDTRYSPEQQELQRATAALVSDLGPVTVDDLDDDDRCRRLAEAGRRSGWFELRARGEDDGPLASGVEVAIVARELGRGAADTAFLGPVLAIDLARQAGLDLEDATTSAVLDTSLVDFALASPSGALDGVAVDCAGAERGIVLATEGPGKVTLLDVVLGEPGSATDLTRTLVPVAHAALDSMRSLDGVPVADAGVARTRALGLAITVADLVGVMEGALATTIAYAKERQQYGVAIGSFQAVQHLLAEARVLVEGSISVAQHAAWAVDALAPDEALEAGAVAKAYCARAARIVCETAIQVHGGIGNTWECFVHVYLRRALLSSALLGDEGLHLGSLARRRFGYDRGL